MLSGPPSLVHEIEICAGDIGCEKWKATAESTATHYQPLRGLDLSSVEPSGVPDSAAVRMRMPVSL